MADPEEDGIGNEGDAAQAKANASASQRRRAIDSSDLKMSRPASCNCSGISEQIDIRWTCIGEMYFSRSAQKTY
jgi:hypothetical protein